MGINAATLQYFPDGDREFLARVFLIEPGEPRPGGRSKRNPKLTCEQLREQAEESGVATVYDEVFEDLARVFVKRRPRSSVSFKAEIEGSRKAVINLLPGESNPEPGLRFQVYICRLAQCLGVLVEEAIDLLPNRRVSASCAQTRGDGPNSYAPVQASLKFPSLRPISCRDLNMGFSR